MLRRLNNLPPSPVNRSHFKSTVFGFLVGVTATGVWANLYLLDKYNMYQSSLKSQMEHLNSSRNDYINLKREFLDLKASCQTDEMCTMSHLMDQKQQLLNIIVSLLV